ncbi:MAG TPA: alpha-hydroxy acid oxidase [Rhizomicrobium sp.]|jgi:4-hydroxymandelate oxidase|nr:alpha-hydroxy acid oxidase [Rhizomicrobium sp.]
MGDIEKSWLASLSRRKALSCMAGLVAASPIAAAMAEIDPRPLATHRRALTLGEMQSTFDFEPLFFGNVPQSIYDYTAHGDGSEFTLRRNRTAYDWVDIMPTRAALPASQVDLSSELLGAKMKFPIIVAPTAAQVPLHPDGEKGMYQAATAAQAAMMLSINTSIPVAQVAPAAQGTLWGQFYPVENLANTQRLIDAYNNAGVVNLFPTVDQQASFYERTQQDVNFGGQARGARGARGGGGAAAPTGSAKYRINGGRLWYTWDYIDAVRKMTKGKMLIKGILEPADALLAIEHGVDAIIVSNHGGRSMDYGPSTLEVLPEIVAAVNGKVPILFDSGIRRGSDIFKALALGANAVMIGRTTRWGLAAYGIPGAQRVIEMLQQELVQVAAAAGCAKLSDINKTTVKANFV